MLVLSHILRSPTRGYLKKPSPPEVSFLCYFLYHFGRRVSDAELGRVGRWLKTKGRRRKDFNL